MICYGAVVHAEKFVSRKDGKEFTKLFVPVGFEVVSVICNGDKTSLAGLSDVPFRLGVKDKELRLFYSDGKED